METRAGSWSVDRGAHIQAFTFKLSRTDLSIYFFRWFELLRSRSVACCACVQIRFSSGAGTLSCVVCCVYCWLVGWLVGWLVRSFVRSFVRWASCRPPRPESKHFDTCKTKAQFGAKGTTQRAIHHTKKVKKRNLRFLKNIPRENLFPLRF